jgi:hypothetical protein
MSEKVSVPREEYVYLTVNVSVIRADKWPSDIGGGVAEHTIAHDNWNEKSNVCIT